MYVALESREKGSVRTMKMHNLSVKRNAMLNKFLVFSSGAVRMIHNLLRTRIA